MTKRASEALLSELHSAVAKDLLAKVKNGEATAQELNAAIKFLQNNGIEAEAVPGNDLEKLSKALPSFEDDEEHTYN